MRNSQSDSRRRRTGIALPRRHALFESKQRTDPHWRRPGENWFQFLDRVDDVYFGRVRKLLNDWYASLPVEQAEQFSARFSSSNASTFDPVFFELWLHELLRRLDLEIEYEPALESTAKRPDFLARSTREAFFVEARTRQPPATRQRSDRLRETVVERIREIKNDNFTIHFDIVQEDSSAPPVGPLARDIEAWLEELNVDEVVREAERRGAVGPAGVFSAGSWRFTARAIPKPAHRRGQPSPAGLISMFPGRSAWGGDWGRTLKALKAKAGRYGDLGQAFVIALQIGDVFVDEEEIVTALFGEPGFGVGAEGSVNLGRSSGLWSGKRNSRVSAVLTARHLVPPAVNRVVPILWRNPDARYPLTQAIPVAARGRFSAEHGEPTATEPDVPPEHFFGLDEDWPGPERPLRVRESDSG